MANNVVNKTVNIFIQSGEAQKAFDALIKKETRLKEELEKATDPKLVNRLNDELKKLEEPIDRARKKLAGELSPSFKDVQAAANSLGNRLKRLSEEDADFSTVVSQYKQASKELDEQKTKVGFLQRAMQSFWKEAKTVAVGVLVGNTVESMLQTVMGYVTGMVTGSAKIADELADIEKTTGLTKNQVKELNSELAKIDTRTSSADLRELASEAGKLGKETVEDVRKFVEEADKINVALGEDLGEGAIISIGKLSKIFKVGMLEIGSAINEIGANSEASESFAVDFLNRLAGTGPAVKLTADQLLGYSAALEVSGQTAEVSGTAMSSFFIDFVRDSDKFGKAAGFASGELKKLIDTNGTNEAFLTFLERLKASNPETDKFLAKMQALGIDGSKGANVMLALSNNIKGVRDQQEIANKAIQSNASIMEEFNKKNNNAAGELDKLKKNFASLFTSSTITDGVQAGVRALNSFINVLKGIPEFIKENKFALLTLVAGLVTLNGAYIKAALSSGQLTLAKIKDTAVTKAKGIIDEIAVAKEIIYSYWIDYKTKKITLATAAQRIWNTVMGLGAGPIGIIITAIGALAIVIGTLYSRMKILSSEQKLQAELAAKVADSTGETINRVETLTRVVNSNNSSLDNRKKALAALIAIAPDYLNGLTLENIKTKEGQELLDKYVTSLRKKAEIEAKTALLTDKLKARNNAIAALRTDGTGRFEFSSEKEIEDYIRSGAANSKKNTFLGIGRDFKEAGINFNEMAVTLDQIRILQKDIDAAAIQNVNNILGNTNTAVGTTNDAAKAAGESINALKEKLKGLQEDRDAATDSKTRNSLNKQIEELEKKIALMEGKTQKVSSSAKKAAKDVNNLEEELAKLAADLIPDSFGREIANMDEKYKKLREKAHGNNRLLLEVERLYQIERKNIIDDYTQKVIAAGQKQDADELKRQQEKLLRLKRLSEVVVSEQMIQLNKDLGNFQNRDLLAAAELNVLKSKGREKLQAELRLLEEQHRQEITSKQLTIFEKEKLDEEYNRKRAELIKNHILGEVQSWVENVSAALNIVGILDQAKTDRENAELDRDRKLNEKKKANLDRQLKAGLLSQQEYDRNVQKIEKAQEKREKETKIKQFKRAQRMQVVQALINGAMAITSTLAAIPGPLDIATLGAVRIAQIGLAVATTAAQVATISKQKPPEFGRGGMLYGPSHSDRSRGMPVTHPYTGQVQAYLEGGEGIASKSTMNDRNQYNISGTPSQIISWLNGANGGVSWETGAVLRPAWNLQKPMPMNFGVVNSSISKMRTFYATGGKFGEAGTATPGDAPGTSQDILQVVLQVIAQNNNTLQNINSTLSSLQKYGVQSNIVLSELEGQQARKQAIEDDATWK